jgi:hypothetical protein
MTQTEVTRSKLLLFADLSLKSWASMMTFRVLQNFVRNMFGSQYKRWSLHLGEEHVKSWNQFDLVLPIKFGFLVIVVNVLTLSN